jgi:hypothetical protein
MPSKPPQRPRRRPQARPRQVSPSVIVTNPGCSNLPSQQSAFPAQSFVSSSAIKQGEHSATAEPARGKSR